MVNYDLKYATNASGAWVVTTIVDSSGSVGGNTSIALDSSGKAHISYNGPTYATNASGSWVISGVDNLGRYTSIALDSLGKTHISYVRSSSGVVNHLKYATNASGSWVTNTVDSCDNEDTSIDLDTSGNVHISYSGGSYLKYATNASGAWVTTTLDGNGGSDISDISMDLDISGNVHISYYYGSPNYNIKYATNASGTWVTNTVDNDDNSIGMDTSVVIDTSGKAHISYCRITTNPGSTAHDYEIYYAFGTVDATSTPAPTPTPSPLPTSSSTPTPITSLTPLPTPAECSDRIMSIQTWGIIFKRLNTYKDAITVKVTCEDGSPVQNEQVTVKVISGKKLLTVKPKSKKTDQNGEVSFSVKTKRKTGTATILFSIKGGPSATTSVVVTE